MQNEARCAWLNVPSLAPPFHSLQLHEVGRLPVLRRLEPAHDHLHLVPAAGQVLGFRICEWHAAGHRAWSPHVPQLPLADSCRCSHPPPSSICPCLPPPQRPRACRLRTLLTSACLRGTPSGSASWASRGRRCWSERRVEGAPFKGAGRGGRAGRACQGMGLQRWELHLGCTQACRRPCAMNAPIQSLALLPAAAASAGLPTKCVAAGEGAKGRPESNGQTVRGPVTPADNRTSTIIKGL